MRIGIDATYRLHGGGSLHLRELLRAWKALGTSECHEIVVFTRQDAAQAISSWADDRVKIRPILRNGAGMTGRLLWEQAVLPSVCVKLNLDVLFCPGNIAPLYSRIPVVVMLQNAAPFCPSITWRSEGLSRWLKFRCRRVMMSWAARRAAKCIFISRWFREVFEQRGYVVPAGNPVIYLGREKGCGGSGDHALVKRLRSTRGILCVSHLYPYKNISALVEAYALQRNVLEPSGLKLYIVGGSVSRREDRRIKAAIARNRLEGCVELTGPVPQEAVAQLMANAEFFVFQSTCENCPSTLIEALAAGVPIACSEVGVMPEIASDAAAFFDPFDPAAIGRALKALATDADLRASLRKKAIARSSEFPTWTEVAQATLNVLEEAATARVKRSGASTHVDSNAITGNGPPMRV